MNPFNLKLLQKIATYLAARGGCKTEAPEYTLKGAQVEVQDAFGFRYVLEIRMIGRIQANSTELLDVNSYSGGKAND